MSVLWAGVVGGVGVGIIVDYSNCYCELSPNSLRGDLLVWDIVIWWFSKWQLVMYLCFFCIVDINNSVVCRYYPIQQAFIISSLNILSPSFLLFPFSTYLCCFCKETFIKRTMTLGLYIGLHNCYLFYFSWIIKDWLLPPSEPLEISIKCQTETALVLWILDMKVAAKFCPNC